MVIQPGVKETLGELKLYRNKLLLETCSLITIVYVE
jgi:hypothetical protein